MKALRYEKVGDLSFYKFYGIDGRELDGYIKNSASVSPGSSKR